MVIQKNSGTMIYPGNAPSPSAITGICVFLLAILNQSIFTVAEIANVLSNWCGTATWGGLQSRLRAGKFPGAYLTLTTAMVLTLLSSTVAVTPDQVSGLLLWLRADTTVETSSGVPSVNNDNIQYWRDRSGNVNDYTQITPANKPLYLTNQLNSKPIIRFNGSSYYLAAAANITTARTLFVVLKMNSTPPTDYTPIWGSTTDISQYLYSNHYIETTWSLAGYRPGANTRWAVNGDSIVPNTATLTTSWVVLSVVTSANVSTNDIGSDRAIGGRYINADIAEMFIYSAALNCYDRQHLEEYLAGKYNLTIQKAPVATGVSKSGTLEVAQTLAGSYTYSDPNADPESTSTFKWYRADDAAGTNATAIAGAAASSYTLTSSELNKYVAFEVFPVAKTGAIHGDSVRSSYTGPVTAAVTQVPPIAASVTVSGTLLVGRTLTGSYTYTDGNGDLEGTSTFKWYRSNDASGTGKAAISGATGLTYILVSADGGKYISFEVTPVALTGLSPGTAVESTPRIGPVMAGPSTSASPAIWLIAAYGIEKASGVAAANNDTIQYWRDQSGNSNDNTQATAASRPRYVQNVLNSQPVIRFDGTDDYTSFTSAINTARTLFIVIKFAGAQGNYTPIWGQSTTVSEYLYNSFYLENVYPQAGYLGATWYENGTSINPLSTAYKTSWVILSVATSANVSLNQLTSDRNLGGRYMGADVAEAFVYNSVLSSADMDSVTYYLANKYNITVQQAPVASSVSKSGTLQAGQVLTGSYTYSDANGDLEGTSTFKWYRADDASGTNSTFIGGATSITYTLTFTDVDKYIAFEVTPAALTGTSPGTAVKSSYTGAVTGSPQVVPVASAVTFSGNQRVGAVQSGTYTYSDANNDLEGTSTFKWYLSTDASGTGKAAIGGATGTGYTPVSGDKGKYLSFEVTPVAQTGLSPGTAVESSPRLQVRQAITFDTTGLLLWVDAGIGTEKSSGVSAGNGEAVQYWRDQSLQVNDISQATTGNRPLLITNSLNSQNVVRFDGSDDYMSFTTGITTARTLFIVIKFAGAQNNYTPIWGHSTALINIFAIRTILKTLTLRLDISAEHGMKTAQASPP
jgi:hypothetical protein